VHGHSSDFAKWIMATSNVGGEHHSTFSPYWQGHSGSPGLNGLASPGVLADCHIEAEDPAPILEDPKTAWANQSILSLGTFLSIVVRSFE
jgi:hypothetical protein